MKILYASLLIALAAGCSRPDSPNAGTAATTAPTADATPSHVNTMDVRYECERGNDLEVRYAGSNDVASSTASFNLNGVAVNLPRKGAVWDNGTYMLKGDDEKSLETADVWVYQHVVEKVNGTDTEADKIIYENCRVSPAPN